MRQSKGLSGLANIGNTCYLNSCIQILSNTRELSDFLESKPKIYKERPEALLLLEWDVLRKMLWDKNCIIAPQRFVASMQKVAAIKKRELFTSFRQNDMQELWLFMIECFHSSLAREVDMSIQGTSYNKTDTLAKSCYKRLKDMYESEYSEMIDLFYGIEVNIISRHDDSKHLSTTPEPFSSLTLSIPDVKRNVRLEECFDLYCGSEEMSGENAWFNDKTNTKEDVIRKVVFWSLPKILMINLNRWAKNGQKRRTMVRSPVEHADFSKYVKGYNADSYIYELYGICNHMGGPDGGHYTAHVLNADGNWYAFNDTHVKKIDNGRIVTSDTYCLFYRKKV